MCGPAQLADASRRLHRARRTPSACSPCAHTRLCHLLPASLRGAADRPARAVWIALTAPPFSPSPPSRPLHHGRDGRELAVTIAMASGPPSPRRRVHGLRLDALILPVDPLDARRLKTPSPTSSSSSAAADPHRRLVAVRPSPSSKRPPLQPP